jgi:phage repressor protein C with HTH and peptisase S24 domain
MISKDIESKNSDLASDFQGESRKLFQAALQRLIKASGGTDSGQLANFLGISRQAINSATAKNKIPPSWFVLVGEKAQVSIDWLVTGEGPMLRGNAQIAPAEAQNVCPIPEGEPQWMSPEAAPIMGYTLVPKVMARLAAGTGSLENDGEVIGYYAFKTDFLRRKGLPKKMVLMDVAGDSMEPVLMDRDSVLIDENQKAIIAGGIFAVGIDQEVYVKYLDKVPGKLILRSKNPEHQPIEVDMNGHLSESVRVIGRVVWSCREYIR